MRLVPATSRRDYSLLACVDLYTIVTRTLLSVVGFVSTDTTAVHQSSVGQQERQTGVFRKKTRGMNPIS